VHPGLIKIRRYVKRQRRLMPAAKNQFYHELGKARIASLAIARAGGLAKSCNGADIDPEATFRRLRCMLQVPTRALNISLFLGL
jgi:hypothetical protein